MYTILLVDDEQIEMDILEHYVPWDQMGIRVAGTAKNGKEALHKLSQLKPDIVLTDVRMPIMDGLEFARRAKQADKSVKIVFLSGHDEFQYIKAALTLEAAGYILKPLDMEELQQVVEHVKKKCDEDRISYQNANIVKEKLFMRLLQEKDPASRKQWVDKLSQLPYSLRPVGRYRFGYLTMDLVFGAEKLPANLLADIVVRLQSLLTDKYTDFTIVELEDTAIGLVLADFSGLPNHLDHKEWQPILEQLSLDNRIYAPTLALSQTGSALDDFPELYREAKMRNEKKFYLGTGRVLSEYDTIETVSKEIKPDDCSAELCRAITHTDDSEAKRRIEAFFSMLRTERVRETHAISSVLHLLSAIEQQFSTLIVNFEEDMFFVDHWKKISSLSTLQDIESYVIQFTDKIICMIRSQEKDPLLLLIRQIEDIIQLRFHTPLTVEDIAKEVYLSPNYIRTLYKERTGETILESVTKLRIQRALELLQDKSLKVHEISHSVGYENVSYFCSIFQKHKGCTPNEYRKKILS